MVLIMGISKKLFIFLTSPLIPLQRRGKSFLEMPLLFFLFSINPPQEYFQIPFLFPLRLSSFLLQFHDQHIFQFSFLQDRSPV